MYKNYLFTMKHIECFFLFSLISKLEVNFASDQCTGHIAKLMR